MRYTHVIAAVLQHPWAILDAKFDAIVQVVARCEAGERLTEEEIRERVGERKQKHQPSVYLEDGRILTAETTGGLDPLSFVMARTSGTSASQKAVAVLPVYGIIAPRVSSLDISESGTGIDALTQQFRAALANPDVTAIVFDFDSPGGSVYGVDELAAEIFAARDQKKIIAQISPMAASAAYYLASQAGEIAITPSGDAGSIGVRSMHLDISKALDQKGIKITDITFGKYKAEGNSHTPLGEDAQAFMQQRVDDYGAMFVGAVARGRGVDRSEVTKEFGQGRMYGASEAKRRGMVDRVATLDQTLARLGVSADGKRVAIGATAPNSSDTTASAETKEDIMETQTSATPVAAVVNSEQVRCEKLAQLATTHNMADKLADWITSNRSVESARDEILASLAKRTPPIAAPPAEDVRTGLSGVTTLVDQTDKERKAGLTFGRAVRCFAAAKGNLKSAAQLARLTMKDNYLASQFEMAADPQTASTFNSGGFLIPENLVMDMIELLRPLAVVRSLAPTLAPLVNGTLSLPKLTGGAVANYVGENKAITPSKVKGGQVKATAKKLATLVPISNDLLRFASIAADTIVRDDMVRAMAQAEDLAFIRGSGSAYSPRGLKYWSNTAVTSSITHSQIDSDTAIQVLNAVFADLSAMRLALRKTNRPFVRPGWIMSPRTENFLAFNLMDGYGNRILKQEMLENGTVLGWPYRVTTQIPENLGGGGIDSEIYLAEFADVVICDAPTVAVEVSNEASYDDGSGNLTSAFSNDQTVIRMINEHDLIMRHDETVIVMNAVEYYV